MAPWCLIELFRRGSMIDQFILEALLAGLCLSLMSGPLGVFVVWRRMSYFGDSLAHSALLGVAIGLWLDISSFLAVSVLAIIIVLLLLVLRKKQSLPNDTLLGIFAHSTLSLGLIIFALMDAPNVDLMAYLFGDILALSHQDLYLLGVLSVAVPCVLAVFWRALLLMTVHRELAKVEGVPVDRIELGFCLLLALVIAVGMKVVGVLLISALLIIPSAAARRFARSPLHMVVLAVIISVMSVVGGLFLSFWQDTPTGASIVVTAALIFTLVWALPEPTPA